MDQLSEFVVNHWILVTAFFVVLGLLISNLFSSVNGVGPMDAVQMINRDGAVVVDIRSKSDFDSGHLIDAVHLPLADIGNATEKLKKHWDKPLIVCCGSGSLSGQAVRKLRVAGFEQSHVLRGGLSAWRNENLPITTS